MVTNEVVHNGCVHKCGKEEVEHLTGCQIRGGLVPSEAVKVRKDQQQNVVDDHHGYDTTSANAHLCALVPRPVFAHLGFGRFHPSWNTHFGIEVGLLHAEARQPRGSHKTLPRVFGPLGSFEGDGEQAIAT